MIVVMRLLLHEDLTWDDLLKLLWRPECISVGPAAALHLFLKKPIVERNVVYDAQIWKDVSAEKDLDPDERIAEWINVKPDLTCSWQRFSGAMRTIKHGGR